MIGTFLGIYVGLIEFDVADIDGSIPSLLAGLKVAFSTSIIGMLASVALKFAQSLKKQSTGKEDVSAGDILQVMIEVRDETKFNRGHMEGLLQELKKAIWIMPLSTNGTIPKKSPQTRDTCHFTCLHTRQTLTPSNKNGRTPGYSRELLSLQAPVRERR